MKKIILSLFVLSSFLFSGCIKDILKEPVDTSGYNCVSGNCSAVSDNAQYGTLSACQSSCGGGGGGGGTAGYNCVSGNCVSVSSGAQYSTLSSCQSSCTSNPPPQGQLMLWTNMTQNGFPCGWNSLIVEIYGVNLSGNTIYAGHYTTAPACGATYCYTKTLAPGNYTVRGRIYTLIGSSCPDYFTNTKTVTVYSNQCTTVVLP